MTQKLSVPQKQRRVAMILSGGGARGAYEVGVLWYIFDDLSRMRGAPPKLDILCGTSVGAINACYLAAHLNDPVLGMRRLVHLWSEAIRWSGYDLAVRPPEGSYLWERFRKVGALCRFARGSDQIEVRRLMQREIEAYEKRGVA